MCTRWELYAVCLCSCVCRKATAGVFLCCSPPHFLRQTLSVSPGYQSVISPSLLHVCGRSSLRSSHLYSSKLSSYWAMSPAPTGTSRRLQDEKGWLPGSLKLLSCPPLFMLLAVARDLEGRLLVSYLSDASEGGCSKATQNASPKWFPSSRRVKLQRQASGILSSHSPPRRELLEMRLISNAWKKTTELGGPGSSDFQGHLHRFLFCTLVSLPLVLMWAGFYG